MRGTTPLAENRDEVFMTPNIGIKAAIQLQAGLPVLNDLQA
jgi:hypothetical protein